MIENSDYYDKQTLGEKLSELGYDLEYREVMGSTMDFSFEETGPRSLLVLTDHQTNGKGRHNNYWNDEKNKAILMTIVEKRSFINELSATFLSHLVALQICLVLKEIAGIGEIKIKWPNDIMLSGKKIAGILIERSKSSTSIGIGINIYGSDMVNGAYLVKKNIKFGRQDIVLGFVEKWHALKVEIESGVFENRRHYYEELWKRNSFILNKKIFMSLKDFVVIGVVKESLLGGNITVEMNGKRISISENDYVPGSCVIG